MRQVKRVYLVSPSTGQKVCAATLWMDGGQLAGKWHSPAWHQEMDKVGVVLPSGKFVYPMNGQAFYDGLDKAYARSSYVVVEVSGEG